MKPIQALKAVFKDLNTPNDKLYTIIIIAVSFKTENSKIELGSFNNVGFWG